MCNYKGAERVAIQKSSDSLYKFCTEGSYNYGVLFTAKIGIELSEEGALNFKNRFVSVVDGVSFSFKFICCGLYGTYSFPPAVISTCIKHNLVTM